jgi:hypothetical protein
MAWYIPCMGRKPIGKAPKIQRGVSLDPEVYSAIQADAERLDKTWNEIAESLLRAGLRASGALPQKQKSSRVTQDDDYVGLPT